MLYRVTHTTHYDYEGPVSQCLNEVRLTPRALPAQQIRETGINVEPAPAFFHRRKDYYGNEVTVFAVFEQHDHFMATADSIVDVSPSKPPKNSSAHWEEVRDLLTAQPDEESLAASEFIYSSRYVPVIPQLAEFARDTFKPKRPLFEAATELSHRIHEEFEYEPKSTSIDTPLMDVLKNRKGVCQDFAHIMIGALRSFHLAARYVSGYVRPGPKVQGAQASHAWVDVFIPEHGWVGFDPTNDVLVSDSHITLAWGRDYGDVTPVKGVTLGGGEQTIKVEVYVRAAE